jgi:DNA-binding transcriptional MerR regulator
MSKYTTGEMAKLCGITVRTVQFYDTKGLLPPSELSDGGRRLYNDDDLSKLRLICTLKALGLSLDSIKGVIESESSGKILSLLLDEQAKQLSDEIKERKTQIEAIKVIKESIRGNAVIPVNSINDIEHMMKNKKGLRKIRAIEISGAVVSQLILIGTVVLWVLRSIWLPFAVFLPVHILVIALLVRFGYENVNYICPECNKEFRPPLKKFWFTSGWKVRWLTCTECGKAGYCVEVYAGK